MPKNNPFMYEVGGGLSIMLGLPTIPSWKMRDRPKKPKTGSIGFNTQTNNLEYWDGKNWFGASMG
jgi:hypothetical protein